jgi:hypothetical protein
MCGAMKRKTGRDYSGQKPRSGWPSCSKPPRRRQKQNHRLNRILRPPRRTAPVGVAPEPGQSAAAIPATAAKQLDNAIPPSQNDRELDFTTNDERIEAIVSYTKGWSKDSRPCSEASLARTAAVDRGDLSKWKKGLLPLGSDKARRIEEALRDNKPPTPAASRTNQG